MELFNQMLSSGTLIGAWGNDDWDGEDSKIMTGTPDANFADKGGKDDWHPF